METSLLMNDWMTEEDILNMEEADVKATLIQSLNMYLDGDTHSMPELSYR